MYKYLPYFLLNRCVFFLLTRERRKNIHGEIENQECQCLCIQLIAGKTESLSSCSSFVFSFKGLLFTGETTNSLRRC